MTTDTNAAAAQEAEATSPAYLVVPLNGTDLRVKPVNDWRPSYIRALRQGDFDGWAEGVLHADDAAKFVEIDATFGEISDFSTAIMTAAGETPGKSSASSRSSRSTRRK